MVHIAKQVLWLTNNLDIFHHPIVKHLKKTHSDWERETAPGLNSTFRRIQRHCHFVFTYLPNVWPEIDYQTVLFASESVRSFVLI